MAREDLPVVGSTYENVITKINAESTTNFYEVINERNKKPNFLHPWWGKKSQGTFEEGNKGRASFTFNDFVYFVVGDTIYRTDNTLIINVIALNFFTTTVGFVGIAANENEIIFVDGAKAFLWNVTTSTGTDVTPNLPVGFAPYDVTFMDGYFILISQSAGFQNRFYISNLNDGSTWNILNFALINSRPTFLNAVSVLKRRVFFFGTNKSELWLDAGAADFPFRRDNNLLLEHGVQATGSVAQGFDRLFYLSGDQNGVGAVMMVTGTTPQPISTLEMDEFIQSFEETTDADGFVFKQNGHIFYQLNFTTQNISFAYNVNMNKWNYVKQLNGNRDLVNSLAFFDDRFFGTSYSNDKLYELSNKFLDNDGEKIRRERTMRLISSPTYEFITYDRIQLDMLKGVGLINTKPISSYPPAVLPPPNASDVDPTVFLSISEDGGVTYFDFNPQSFGKAGDRLIRIIWVSLGRYRDMIARFTVFNSVPVYILGGSFDFTRERE